MESDAQQSRSSEAPQAVDVVIVGAGFAGMYMLYKLRELGLSARVYEMGTGVGGTWYWNRYPGARVDLESREYSYSFSKGLEQDWRWSERYAAQPELLRYANFVADRFDLRRDIKFETRITSMVFDEESEKWIVSSDKGDRVVAPYCVMATGCLSIPKDVDLPGIPDFQGAVYRTNLWPKENVDFTGQRVAVVGTGSSGIQSIPEIARQAAHLTVFQRTPNFSLPSQNGPMEQPMVDEWLQNRESYRGRQRAHGAVLLNPPESSALEVTDETRSALYESAWSEGGFRLVTTFTDLTVDKAANDTAAEFIRSKIRSIVRNPAVAEKLCPTNHPFMTKRPCVDTGYYETFNRDNVELIDVREKPIESVTARGIRVGGEERQFNSIVLAIGFDAVTGALCRIDIRGRGGIRLKEEWSKGPRTYLGIAVAGFPNMFIITGPGSPSVLSNMIVSIEQHVEWITDCIAFLRRHQIAAMEPEEDAQEAWMEHVSERVNATLFPLADSWWIGANVPGKPRVFLAYVGSWESYCAKCNEVVASGYEGFRLSAIPASPASPAAQL